MGAATTAAALETRNLSHAVVGKILVSDVSVQVRPGEVMAVVGPSGAGKSSFLRLLNRLDEPTGGTVLLNGLDYRTLPPRELRRRVGMVMQMAYLFPGTVTANIGFGPRQRGEIPTGDDIAVLLERVGLPGYQDRDVSTLSGGEAQRVSMARTLANAPDALLLDEPTSALDVSVQAEILNLLKTLRRETNVTYFMVSHDIAVITHLCDRIAVMAEGRIIEEMTAADVRGRAREPYTRTFLEASAGYVTAS